MKLCKENAKGLIGKRVDCYKRRFGYYPLIIKQKIDGTLYTKNNLGVCVDIPERESNFNCYDFDFVVLEKMEEIIKYLKDNHVSCKISESDTDDYEDSICIFSYGNLTRDKIVEKVAIENNLCIMFFEQSIREDLYNKTHVVK